MSITANKRLQQDLRKIIRDPPPGISAHPSEADILDWRAMVSGPEDTPFEGGVFRMRLKFSPNYPQVAPAVWFYSKMFHPNVYKDGKICLDILEEPDKWLPDYDVSSVLCAIQSLLGDPNPNSPANGVANGLFMRDRELYEKTVRQFVASSNSEEEEVDDDVNCNELSQFEDSGLEDLEANIASLDLSEFSEQEKQRYREFLKGS